MEYGFVPLEKRLKENIKNYRLKNLFQMNELQEYLKCIATTAGIRILLTERHGEKAVAVGDFAEYKEDVVNNPGRKLRVHNRTIGHLYVVNDNSRPDRTENAEELLDTVTKELAAHALCAYELAEKSMYLENVEAKLEIDLYQTKHGVKTDAMTGTLNKNYFENRLQVLDRSEVLPVAVICLNINDWKYVNDHFGEEESDRLIKVIADIILKEAKPEYVIGRVDGDVFHAVIPMPEDGEEQTYCRKVQQSCLQFKDQKLAPSVACGYVMKTNVEEKLFDLLSEAEYEMFRDKFEIKNRPGYRERLEKC